MRRCAPSGPVARPLPLLISGSVLLTGELGSSLPAAGRLRVLRKKKGPGKAIVLLARPGLGEILLTPSLILNSNTYGLGHIVLTWTFFHIFR